MAPAEAGGTLEVRLVGRVAVRVADGWRDDWPRPAARRLVALLALSATRSVPREVVADRLFGHLPPDRALRNVSKALSQARTVLGPGVLEADAAGVWVADPVQVRTDVAVDADRLRHAVADPPPPGDWPDLRTRLARADQLLAEDLYEDWAQESRQSHERLALEAGTALARASGAGSDWSWVLSREPCDTEAWAAVLSAAADRGPEELDTAYAECRLVHSRELGARPADALRQLVSRLREGQPTHRAPDATVGHRDELRWIEDRVPTTARGGDTWVLHGAAGIGKTHLLRRAADDLREHGCLVAWATCVSGDPAGPYAPLASALRLSHSGSDPVLEVLERGGSGAPEGWSATRLADDVAALLEHDGEPVVLVIDDVHWADPVLKALLTRLCSLAASRRWSLVMAGRSDESDHPMPPVPTGTGVLRVTPLAPDDSAVLARRLLGQEEATDPTASEAVVQALVERSAGNPFFLTELAHGAGGAPVTGPDIPDRIQALLRRRVGLLADTAREALVLISLAAEQSTAPLLAAILGDEPAARAVRELRAHALLSGTPLEPRPNHPLLREAVVADLSAAQAGEAHGRLGPALAELAEVSGRRDLRQASARHTLAAYTAYPSADRAPAAAEAGLAAGARALRSFAPDAAARLLEEGLAAFADCAEPTRSDLTSAAVAGWLDLGRCRALLRDPEGAERALRTALALAERPLDRAQCYRRLAALHYRTGRMAETAGILDVALAETTDELSRALLETELGWTLTRRGRAAEALPILERAAQVLEDGGDWDLAAWSLDYLAMSRLQVGEAETALALLDRALARDGVGTDHPRRGVLLIHRAGVLRGVGRPEAAVGSVTEGLRILRRSRDRYLLSVGCRAAADVHDALGDLTSAVRSRTEELSLLGGTHNVRHVAAAQAHLASLHRRLGNPQEAERSEQAAREAVELAADPDVAAAVADLLARGNTAGTPAP